MEAATLELSPQAAPDWTVPQQWERFTAKEHAVWDTLFARQTAMLPGRASDAFLRGVDVLRLSKPGIPDFVELSGRLMAATGWRVVAVPGLVPDAVFFDHLANRTFVAGNFIRTPDQLDYLKEPDVFHDVFGHVPMLADPMFADYMAAYGRGGQRAGSLGALKRLARLYWYTVEFGLVEEAGALRIYGAGIVSSHGESLFALDDPSPNRIGFDLNRVIPSFSELLRTTVETDFGPLYAALERQHDLGVAEVVADDRVLTRGTQRYPAQKCIALAQAAAAVG
jgi:phenylalanine-4-hydroxylase